MSKVKTKIREVLNSVIPFCSLGDKFVSWLKFISNHKRVPKNQMLFNDYLYNLKVNGGLEDPLRVFVSDKEYVKLYVKAMVGDKFNVPTIKVLRNEDEIDSFSYPKRCCIKPTHASKEVILRLDGEEIDRDKMKRWLSLDFYRLTRQPNYKNLSKKVIVEPIIFDEEDLSDYRFYCYEGKVKLISVDIGKYSSYTRNFFNKEWVEQDYTLRYPRSEEVVEKPGNLEEMIMVAEKLSSLFCFVRVDLYSDGNKCYVGEVTNCHANAGQSFIPKDGERKASAMIFE